MRRRLIAPLTWFLTLVVASLAFAEAPQPITEPAETPNLEASAVIESELQPARARAVVASLPESFEASLARLGYEAWKGRASQKENASWGTVYQCHVECPSGCFVDCIDTNPCGQTSNSVSCHGQTYSCGNIFDEICLGF